jgi:putative SOS response-associated peptidase YedK
MLISPAEDTLTMYPVSKIVGNVKNDTEECLVPIMAGGESALS